MSGFIQVIEWKTSRIKEVQAYQQTYRSRMAGLPGGPERITVTADRTRPGTYLTVVEFASYEAAMENSHRPETTDFAKGMAALCDGPPTFYDLDVLSTEVRMDAGKAAQKARG